MKDRKISARNAKRRSPAKKNPAKDAERAAQLAPFEKAVAQLKARASRSSPGGGQPPLGSEVEAVRWLLEEFRVSLFAQELGTAEPVSAVKLERALAALQPGNAGRVETAPVVAPKPIVSAPVNEKKIAPIKNLNALDKLFSR